MMIAISDHGCSDTIEKPLPTADWELKTDLKFPTAFAPSPAGPSGGYYNLNEVNNIIFHPKYSEEPVEYYLKIYNRSGELIFESTDIQIGWDGYYFQQASASGVYIWTATGKWKDGTPFEYSGDVTLIWER